MPVPFIACRNTVTGGQAELPETALPHMTHWVPVAQLDAEAGGGVADPAGTSDGPDGSASTPAAGESDAADAPSGPSRRNTRKPADSATEKKES